MNALRLPLALLAASSLAANAQLFDNLALHASSIYIDNDTSTEARISPHGPKGIASSDFDLDGHADVAVSAAGGDITILFGDGEKLAGGRDDYDTGAATLRGIVAADFNADGRDDVASLDPFIGDLHLLLSTGNPREFSQTSLPVWRGARNLVADDFDGDGTTDLVIGGKPVGLRLLKGDGLGGFTASEDIPGIVEGDVFEIGEDADEDYNQKPVFTLRTFRPAGGLPKLVATHAWTTTVFVLGVDAGGDLVVEHRLFESHNDENALFPQLHDFAIAPIAGQLTSTVPDMITVSKVNNKVTVWRGTSAPPYFNTDAPYQEIAISGGPRSVKVADFDGDGWGDLALVVRFFNRALIYKNTSGSLEQQTEIITGHSPRDLVIEDLDENGTPDLVVINRRSRTLTQHFSDPTQADGFNVPRQLYATDADPAGLSITDMNDDGRGDILQLHRASGDVSIRLSNADGTLGDPQYYLMGINPNGFVVRDINRDGIPDVSVANLGRENDNGNLSVRLGDGAGGLGELTVVEPPILPNPDGQPLLRGNGIFSIVQADLDNDGYTDQVVGYYDCRVTFLKGRPDGSYETTVTTTFVYESRVMLTGDFDQDGDLDIVGFGAAGDGVVLVNEGDFFTNPRPTRNDFEIGQSGSRSAVLSDLNDDGDPDVVVGTYGGLVALYGGEGATFSQQNSGNKFDLPQNINGAVSSVIRGDFDNNGTQDYAVACAENSLLEIYSGGKLVLSLTVPAANYVVAGDIDGDGLVDLAGTGAVLWIALSGNTPPPVPLETTSRPKLSGVLINEIIAKNDNFPLAESDMRTSDAIELFNSTAAPVDLVGWSIGLETDDGETAMYTVPESTVMPPDTRIVFVCREDDEAARHTGYKLPAGGGKITLTDAASAVSDEVRYPAIAADISMARYGDANPTFYFNAFPDIGSANLDNGLLDPDLRFLGVEPLSPAAGEPVTFKVRAADDIGLMSLVIYWRELGVAEPATGEVALYDDGMHGDGGMLDGLFAGTLDEGFPDAAEIEFYARGVDLSDAEKTIPGSPLFTFPGLPIRNFSMAIGSANDLAPGLQVSEIVAANDGLVVDENGEAEDWIEVRNTSDTAISLDGLGLAQNTSPRMADAFLFPAGTVLQPGDYLLVWADNDEDEGPMHAPFKLSTSGESIALFGQTASGATAVIGGLSWNEIEGGVAFATLGLPDDHLLRTQFPTPGGPNFATQNGFGLLGTAADSGELLFVHGTGETGNWTLQRSTTLGLGDWQTIDSGTTNRVERLLRASPETDGGQALFRVTLDTPSPQN